MSVKKTRRSKEPDTLTIAEFKHWLAGVEDMQPDGWVPDAVQWAKIRAKINCLAEEETAVYQQPAAPVYQQPVAPMPMQQYHPQPAPQSMYSTLAEINPARQPPHQTMLADDGILMPTVTHEDAQFNQSMQQHVPSQFD